MKLPILQAASLFLLFMVWMNGASVAQVISGRVLDEDSREPLIGAVIQEVSSGVKLAENGVVTDNSGRFTITAINGYPVRLAVSYLGYTNTEIQVRRNNADNVRISLKKDLISLDDVVIRGNKYNEEDLRSDVSFDRITIESIQATPSFSYYDAVSSLSEVDMATQGIQNKSVNTRGFNIPGNTRFLQMIDGMDNQAPGFNFSLGEFAGLSELDVESVELFPGTASYKYGPGATNGALVMRSKNPFEYQGISAQMKLAANNLEYGLIGYTEFGATPLYDLSVRYAKAINDKWAYKTTISMLTGTDWPANNIDNIGRGNIHGLPSNSPGYDGVNVYGDEVSQDLFLFFYTNRFFDVFEFQQINRTGYPEDNLFDYRFTNFKVNTALHHRINNDLEVAIQGNLGTGSTFYTGDSRSALRDFTVFQTKIELTGSNFVIRGYTSQQRSGNSYDAKFLALHLNERAKSSTEWFQLYELGYNGLLASRGFGLFDDQRTREIIDGGFSLVGNTSPRYVAGTERFDEVRRELINTIGFEEGAGFRDNSRFYHFDGVYQLDHLDHLAEVELGASYRFYDPRSNGNIFADFSGNDITMYEIGSYVSASRKVISDQLTLSTSLRVDKNENFNARFTPRFSTVYSPNKDHFFRASVQNGFRNPSLREQFQMQGLELNNILVGGVQGTIDLLDLPGNAFRLGDIEPFQDAVSRDMSLGPIGDPIIESGDPLPLIQPQADLVNLDLLRDQILTEDQIREIKPERITSFEVGYRGVYFNEKLVVDINYYQNRFKNFIGTIRYIKPKTSPSTDLFIAAGQLNNTLEREVLFVYSNATEKVKSQGLAVKLDYTTLEGWQFNGNASWAELISDPDDPIIPGFNTPAWKVNLGLGHKSITPRIGANINFKARPSFQWQSNFEDGEVPEAYVTDVQVSYRIPGIDSLLKLGVSNISNIYYENTFGGPRTGALPYLQITYNPMMY